MTVEGRQPLPPPASRQDALGQLRRERWFAQDAGESDLVAELDRKIERLSAANSPVPPGRETTSATTHRERRATTPRSTQHDSG